MGHGARPDADQREPAEYHSRYSAPEQRIAVRLLVEPKDKELFLAAGARGAGAIYTEHGKIIHIIRKVFVRVSAKIDWFVFKLH